MLFKAEMEQTKWSYIAKKCNLRNKAGRAIEKIEIAVTNQIQNKVLYIKSVQGVIMMMNKVHKI